MFEDGELGIDLVALNVQRGRDHGLPGYIKYRHICNVGTTNSFDDLEDNISREVGTHRIKILNYGDMYHFIHTAIHCYLYFRFIVEHWKAAKFVREC